MTREDIKQVAENYASQMCNDCSAMLYCEDKNKKCVERREREKIFADGVKWAEECLNLSSLWHSADEEPEIGSNIVVVDYDGQWWNIQPYDGDYDGYGKIGWASCATHYNIKQWAYIDDLLPKGGKA